MNLQYACLECLLKQARATTKLQNSTLEQSVLEAVGLVFENLDNFRIFLENPTHFSTLSTKDKTKLQKKLRTFFTQKGIILNGDFEIPPTLLAVLVYEKIAKILKNSSPYLEIKTKSIAQARIYKQGFMQCLEEMLKQNLSAKEILEYAVRICVLGNVIDYGAQCSFDLELEAKKILKEHFAHFALEPFMKKIKTARQLVFIGDNAGENEFDEILIVALKALYPNLKIYYFVRGAEIINDITLRDLQNSDSTLLTISKVIDSGVLSPGFIESLASIEAKEIYRQADVILAKGMGNFESMESCARKDERVFLLFKIKCSVVRDYLKKNLGDFVFFSPFLEQNL
ncbi:damage-control phosphatase ARMT1 family protein [Helicobacter turcicus]|uniref:ARMT1-like domain-containing protein n=1 Tax=Helicobacter turcicus TaxID=2867412 RepID=A0ABS7JMY3_9HELI|nr:ARMT1-like domain-containing protein [Helicobacter turcicus]MBX7545658.1 ARMT1-like domain-containing protein [Helicobacter turcicus]